MSHDVTRSLPVYVGWVAAVCALGLAVSQPLLAQQPGTGLARYRNFELGSTLAVVAAATGMRPTDAIVMHQRPALLQELTWRLVRWNGSAPTTDPVNQIRFSFYDDQLFRIVVEYLSDKTAGMTDADLLAAFSESYGPPRALRSFDADAAHRH